MYLEDYGWTDHFSEAIERLNAPELEPARVVLASGVHFRIVTRTGEQAASLAGRLRHEASSPKELPAVGDWVAVRGTRIEHVLPRRARLSRKVAGKRTEEQIVAANVDTVVVVMGLDGDFSPRRLERYLTTVWESGASPVVLLNKADLHAEVEGLTHEIDSVAMGAPVLVSSCLEGTGIDEVRARLRPRETSVLVGSSGAGKSTLINRLLGRELLRTRAVREGDDRGRHTTTHRELFVLPGGALLIDNPGIRELQLWADESSLDQSFEDVAELAEQCRYGDCSHEKEPGCAVRAAVDSGTLARGRLESYHSLQKELRYLRLRQDESAKRVEKQKWRAIHREMRKSGRHRRT